MYLSIGMTYDQFFRDDPYLCRYYLKAEEMRTERVNNEAWLNGMYVYNAFSVVMANAFSKKGTKPKEYPKEPYKSNKPKNTESKISKEIEKQKELKASEAWMYNFIRVYGGK